MSEEKLPVSWDTVEIEEVLLPYPNGKKIRQGWSPQCENHAADSHDDWAVLRTSAIQDGMFVDAENKKLPPSLEPRTQLEVIAGDILMTCAGPRVRCGVTCLVRSTRPRLLISGKMYQLRANTEIVERRFLELFLRESGTKKKIDEMKTGISDSGLNLTHDRFRTLTIPLPPLPEQKRIVAKIEELFSELEAGEESLRKARRQLGVYRQSLLKQAFEGKLTAQWRTQNRDKLESPASLLARIQSARQARHEKLLGEWKTAVKEWESAETDEKRPPKPQKLIPISENIEVFSTPLPEGWVTLNLSQFVLELGQGWSPKCENHEAQGDEWAVIKTTAIQFGNFDPSANKALPKHLPPRRWLGLRSGEILITRAGPRSRCGVVCRVRGDHPRLMICDKAYRLVLFEGATSSEFVERLLCSPAATSAIEKLKTGINDSGVNITQSAFLQLVLPIPPHPEQQEIGRLLDEQFDVIERNEQEIDGALRKSEALRQSILKKAFSGKLVPQDPTDEPVSELLARIRAEKEAPSAPKLKGRQGHKPRNLTPINV